MNFTLPLPEPKPWRLMSDPERLAFFRQCTARQPQDYAAFREALEQKRHAHQHTSQTGSHTKA